VLAQLGNRVQHALRAFHPRDQKAVAAAAETFRPNPKLDTAQVITQLGKGRGAGAFLEGDGTPAMVERVMIRPAHRAIGNVTPEERQGDIEQEPGKGKIRHQRSIPSPPMRCCRSAWPEPRAVRGRICRRRRRRNFWGRSARSSERFSAPTYRAARCRPVVIARSVTRSVTNKVVGGLLPISANRMGGSIGGSVVARWYGGALGRLVATVGH